MPIYTLKCNSCNNIIEKLASISEMSGKKIECSFCGSFDLSPVIVKAPSVIVKGGECRNAHTCTHDCPCRHK